MQLTVTVVDPQVDLRRDVLVHADDSTPVGDVLDQLTALTADRALAQVVQLGGGSTPTALSTPWFHRGRRLDPTVPLAESGLVEGSLIALGDAAASLLDEPDGLMEVRVVGGLGAGAVHRLPVGEATIGSDPGCVVVLPYHHLPALVATVKVSPDRALLCLAPGATDSLTAYDEERPLTLDREPLTPDPAGTPWPPGAQLAVGGTVLELERVEPPDAAVQPAAEPGWLDYNRPPRLLPPPRTTTFRLPSPPTDPIRNTVPWVVMVLPLVVAVALAMVFHRWYLLAMGFMSPVMMLGSYLQGRKQGKVTHREQLARYRKRKARVEADAEAALVEERLARRLEAPDPALALLVANGPRARLWERRRDDPDYLSLRIGVGDLISEVVVEDPDQPDHRRKTTRTAYDVPVTVPLGERGVLGIAGRGDLPRRLGAWAVAQVAVLHSPRDTQLYVLTDAAGASAWEWLRWLPHARPQQGQDTVVTLGVDAESCARRVAELSAMVAARRSALAQGARQLGDPDVVVVLDGARRLRSLPGVVSLLRDGPAVGVRSICLDADERLLPEEASAVVVETARGVRVQQQRRTVVEDVTPDLVELPWLQRVARALAPLRDISVGEDAVLPTACRLTEVLGMEPPTADLVRARWLLSPRSTSATIGVSLDGPFALDLRRDGPHGLVAGTTGAGKSELLQTLVASLAVANRPDAMTFVLVDYKGGAAFKDCVDLPHTVGMVTDLDSHLVERALVSLGAELTRREHLLAQAGAKDIEDYLDLQAQSGRELPALPRLLIVIDEFASLARELPDFVTGLVNIAQRGRSLGIHLLLATQRPGGVVSPEIRANTNLRIALRVTDSSESSDVLGAPDAATISKSTPGRAYVRLGASSLVPFQAGRVGGRRPGTLLDGGGGGAAPWLRPVSVPDLAQPVPAPPRVEAATDAEVTDLTVLVGAVREADRALGTPPQHSPWLPALTTEVLLDDLLPEQPDDPGSLVPPAPYALEDLPAEQARRTATIDLATFSHLSIVGGPRSGRSQALRTIAASLAQVASPADVHLYGLDCGNGALLPLADLPHCGAVVQRTQPDRVQRLLGRFAAELARRQELLGAGGFADLTEQRAATTGLDRLPHVLLLLDRWEGFVGTLAENDGGAPLEQVQTLLREGASVGLHLVLTGDKQLVSARMASLVEEKIALRLPDRADFTLLGLRPRTLPDTIPEGRGFRSETGVELQVALLDADTSGQAQAAAVRRVAAQARERYAAVPRAARPFRVDVLPPRITFEDAWRLRDLETTGSMFAMVGVGGDELTAVGFDLARIPQAIVAGPPRTGRSTVLLAVAESLLRGGSELVVAAPRPSPLRDLAGRPGVRAVLTGVELTEAELAGLLDPGDGPVVLVVDDGELLKDVEAKSWLKALQRTAGDRGRAIVLGGDSGEVASGFSGWQVDMKGRQGLLLNPQGITDGELLGVRLPRSVLGASPGAGRALAQVGDGTLRTVQVPVPD